MRWCVQRGSSVYVTESIMEEGNSLEINVAMDTVVDAWSLYSTGHLDSFSVSYWPYSSGGAPRGVA